MSESVGVLCPHCGWSCIAPTFEESEKMMNSHTREMCTRQKLTNVEMKVDHLTKLAQDILAILTREAERQKLRGIGP